MHLFTRSLVCLLALSSLSLQGAGLEALKSVATYHYDGEGKAPGEALALIVSLPPDQYEAAEKVLLEGLADPAATQEGKAFICRFLQHIGSDKSIPALQPLLSDEVLSDYARLALERIGTPACSAAMLGTLDQAPDKAKPGLLGSLGNLRDAQAVDKIAKLVSDKNPVIASSALAALGKIGGPAAAKVLMGLNGIPDSLKRAYLESLLACAGTLKGAEATPLYEKVYASTDTISRVGALCGLLRSDENKATAEIKTALQGTDLKLTRGILGFIAGGKGSDAFIKAMGGFLAGLPAESKARLIVALGAGKNPAALEFITPYLTDSDPAVAAATIQALGEIGNKDSLKLLLASTNPLAIAAIAHMTDPSIDETLLQMLEDKSLTPSAIKGLIARNSAVGIGKLLSLTGDSDPEVRLLSWKALRNNAGEKEIVPMAEAAFTVSKAEEQEIAFDAVKKVCAAASDKEKCFVVVQSYYPKGATPLKLAILDIGSVAGTPSALELEKQALASGDPELAAKAVRALAAWSNPSAAPLLLDLASKGATDSDKIVALRGYIQIASTKENKMGGKDRAAMLKNATALATRKEEKILILSATKLAEGPDVLPLITEYVQNSETRAEGESAALELLKGIKNKESPDAQGLGKLLLASSDAGMVDKAKQAMIPPAPQK
jgi:HEAT repeat protein